MYKIEIDWNFKSPHLQVLTGTVRIDNIQMGSIDRSVVPGFPVKKEMNTCGYKDCPAIFDSCKPLVDVMVRSYYDGMRLSKQSIEWFGNGARKNNEIFLTLFD